MLEQLLRPHAGGDGVEHDADALGELVEEREVNVGEAVERGQLDDGLDFALEDDRDDDDVPRPAVAEPRADAHVVRRHVGDEDPRLLQGALAHQPFADLELIAQTAALLVSVAAQQPQRRSFPRRSP